MRIIVACLWVAVVLLSLASIGSSQMFKGGCSGGACSTSSYSTMSAVIVPTDEPKLEWRVKEIDPGRVYLYWGEHLIGGYDKQKSYWRPYLSRSQTWGPVSKMPVPFEPPLPGPGEAEGGK